MKAKVILNPYANRWNAQKRIPEVKSALEKAGIEYDLSISQGPGHCIQLAAEAALGSYDIMVAAGGDGTIGEVVNGLCRAFNVLSGGTVQMPLGVLPLGSANDLVVNLKLPKTLDEAAQSWRNKKWRMIDLGHFRYQKSPPASKDWGESFFGNNSAIGLEPTITLIQQSITWMHGPLRYLLATLIGIARNPKWHLRLEWDAGTYEGDCTLVTVGNNPLTGGLFYMTPHADPSDGKLTFVYGYMDSRAKILKLLPRTMKPGAGSYVEHPAIHEYNATWLKIQIEKETPIHADGEIQSKAVTAVEYEIYPAKLLVLTP